MSTKLPEYTYNPDQENHESLTNIQREQIACYGGAKILTEGFASEAIAIPTKRHKDKGGFFTRIFNIFN